MSCDKAVYVVLAWLAIPDALYIFVYTAIGAGADLYNYAADDDKNALAALLALASGAWMILLFIFDWDPVSIWQLPFGVIQFFFFLATASYKAVSYPWAGGFVCLLASLGMLGFVRAQLVRSGKQGIDFYKMVVWSFFSCAFFVAVIWFYWMTSNDRWWTDDTKDWLAGKNEDVYKYFEVTVAQCSTTNTGLSADAQALLTSKCKKAKTVWFLQWSGPFVAIVCNCVCGLLCVVFDRPALHAVSTSSSSGDVSIEEQRKTDLKLLLRRCVLILAFSVGCMYCSLYVSGAAVNLGSALLCLAVAGTSLLLGWMYLEIDQKLMAEVAKTAPFADYVIKASKSDWLRAFAVGGLHLFIPFMALLDTVRQQVRLCKGTGTVGERFTARGKVMVDELYTWNWVSIFTKVILLGELFVVLIVGSKFTFVFFSWLNESLEKADMEFAVVSGMVFIIGFGMFMCPIVPGSAVYLFAGVVLGAQGQIEGSVGFWPGTGIACIVGSLAKMMACCGQYGLGFMAGKFIKVQQFVGVDKVPTRAMEKVLKESGMKPGKVCILVAGPDFPVSMLCGILQLNIPQMLMGTLPVILVSIIPQTLVGALLTKDGGDTGVWSMISTGVTGFAAVFQAGATFIYIYFIMKTIEVDGEELAKPRPEHEAIAKLTRQEEAYVQAYKEATEWNQLSGMYRLLILSSASAFLIAGFVIASDFVVSDKYCFRPFSITDRIGASRDLGGLDNSALNLVMTVGWFALALVVVGFLLNYLFGKLLASEARQRMKSSQVGVMTQAGQPPQPVPLGHAL